jgi:probable HAF family extracellular repeat protein
MLRFNLSEVVALATAVWCGSLGQMHANPLQYAITNLGVLGTNGAASAFSKANAINSSGQIAGTATTATGTPHAFFYDGQMHDLGSLLTNGSSSGFGLNDTGTVVGQSSAPGASVAFYFDTGAQGAVMVDMGTLTNGSGQGSTAFAINNQGVIVGNSYHGNGLNPNGFRYFGGTMQGLGDLEHTVNGVYYSGALAVNNNGVVAGEAQDTSGTYHAFIDSGTMMGLPLLAGDSGSDAYAINSSDVVVGQTGDNAGIGPPHPVMWSGGGVTALGGLTTNKIGTAYGINDSGQIVGSSYDGSDLHAFIYTNGTMTDLNTLVAPGQMGGFLYLAQASAINNSGSIVGFGYLTSNGFPFAFLAVPNIPTLGGTGPTMLMSTPVITNNLVLLSFSVGNLTNGTFHLLQASQLAISTSWTTNTTAVLTTNTVDSSYQFMVTNDSSPQFFRVQTP